ncbi:MAG TPA: mechanosensitive ion channel [Sedimentisphaerales bacterium]|mgnify:CR=1 FL=1|nr:mechanosensitive ion channel [Sedimentisphaerales bacterium]HRS10086.1 mechanosensitive ion channel [Sedimentisphaerales bacterium]HRV46792.1 mechanosensitive ion channel [Sedimentisphaerales bacterium]
MTKMDTDRPAAATVCLMALAAILLLSASAGLAAATAQATPSGPAEVNEPNTVASAPLLPGAAATATPRITPEDIAARKKQIADSQELADDIKTRLTEIYDRALAQLKLAGELAEKGKQYDLAVKNAPPALEEIRKSLAQPAAAMPEVAADLTLAQAEQALAQATTALEEAKKTAADLEDEPRRRADRKTKIPEESKNARQRLDEIQKTLAAVTAQEKETETDRANRALLAAEQEALQSRLNTSAKELLYYDTTNDLLAARRDLAARQLAATQKRLDFWQNKVSSLRQQAAQAAQSEALRAQEQSKSARPEIQPIVQKNAELAQHQAELVAKIQGVTRYAETVDTSLATIRKDFDEIRSQIETAGRVTDSMGILMLGKRDKLPDVGERQRRMRERPAEIVSAQLQAMAYDRQWSELSDLTDELEEVTAKFDANVGQARREAVRREATDYYENQRKLLRAISDHYWDYATRLARLDSSERLLVKTVEDFSTFIDANVLWVKSERTPGLSHFGQAARAILWLLSPANWHKVARTIWNDVVANPMIYVLIGALTGAVVTFRRRIHDRIQASSDKVRQIETDCFFLTVEVLVLTALLAAIWPMFLLLAHWRLSVMAIDDFVRAVAAGLGRVASAVFILSFLSGVAMPHGLAHAHFRIREEPLTLLRRHLRWFLAFIIPVVFVSQVMRSQQTDQSWYGAAGRLVFIVGQAGLAVLLLRVLHPAAPLMDSWLKQRRGGWMDRLRFVWYPACLLAPLSFATLAGMGYLYGARHLNAKLMRTIGLILAALLVRAMFVRGLTLAQRRLALLERRRRRAASEQKPPQDTTAASTTTGETAESKVKPEPTIFEMSQQTRKLIAAATGILLVLGAWYIWKDVLPALTALGRFRLYKAGPEEIVTLGAVMMALVLIALTVLIARNVPGLLELAVLRHLPLDRGVRFAIITVCRYLLVVIGVVLAFTELGIGWSKVQWLIAAMTVGLGFGLQEIFANFISGLIMLFEQPIRVDDIVTVGDVTGRVTMIHIRATTIRKWDQRELIVPNKEFITGRLINWTLSDNTLRRDFPVGIAYGSDIRKAEQLLYEIARNHPLVLKDPEPIVLFKGFGTSSLDFELRVYFSGIENNLAVWHDINFAIDDAFRQAGVEIAFPQQDVHIRTIDREIPIRLEKPPT